MSALPILGVQQGARGEACHLIYKLIHIEKQVCNRRNKSQMDKAMRYRKIWPKNSRKFDEYMAGLILGDGQIEAKRITITDQYKIFLAELADEIKKHWNVTPSIHSRRRANAYYLRIYNKKLAAKMQQLVENLRNNPTTNFIRGFFDAEGTITSEKYYNKTYIVIEIVSADPLIIANLQSSLYDRCIYGYNKQRTYYDKRRAKTYTSYRLIIKRQSSVERFLLRIGVRHIKHIVKLTKLSASPSPL